MGSLAKATIAAVFGLSLATATGASAASSISNIGDPSAGYLDIGITAPPNPTVHTVGQLFSVPVPGDNILVNFSLVLGPPADPQTLPVGPLFVRAAIFEWNPAVPGLGGFVWDSGSDVEIDLGNRQVLSFGVGTTLDPLLEYIAFVTLSGNDPGEPDNQGSVGFGVVSDDGSVPGGAAFFYDDGATQQWYTDNGFDAEFAATFANERDLVDVPAPGALAIFGMGLAGLGLALRRRRSA